MTGRTLDEKVDRAAVRLRTANEPIESATRVCQAIETIVRRGHPVTREAIVRETGLLAIHVVTILWCLAKAGIIEKDDVDALTWAELGVA